MDLLAQRYASPFLMLDEFIRLNQLHDFAIEILDTIAKEKVHDARWEFYLHKVWDVTFDEYCRICDEKTDSSDSKMSEKEILNVVSESRKMLEGFSY